MQEDGLVVSGLLDDLVCGRLGFVDKIGIEYIELVSLHNFRRRVVGTATASQQES